MILLCYGWQGSKRAVRLQQAIVALLRISSSYTSINISVKPVGLPDSHFDPKVHIHILGRSGSLLSILHAQCGYKLCMQAVHTHRSDLLCLPWAATMCIRCGHLGFLAIKQPLVGSLCSQTVSVWHLQSRHSRSLSSYRSLPESRSHT